MATDDEFDALNADQLRAKAPDAVIGREIIILPETSSTNDAISRLVSADNLPFLPEGVVVFAESQTDGRGQRGNRWESAAGKGLWFSILLRPKIQLPDSGHLTIWAIHAVADVIHTKFGFTPAIKLPNDVQLNGRKVSGVLVEMRAQNSAPHVAVVGIGINVNQSRSDFSADLQDRATSVAMALGRQVDRNDFGAALLRKLDATYRQQLLGRTAVRAGATTSARTTSRDRRVAKFRTA
jgi:BirA family biotin operon repressor/biotin-[acetyl-CoA-carboxylase] ligase